MSWCVIMSYCYGEDDSIAFMISMILTFCGGMVFLYGGRNATSNMSRRDSYLVVTATWIIFSVFGMLPYMIGGYISNLTDAYSETMSGFTTTGASILDDVEILPHGILFWRSLSQWIGGLGIVFFTIAILPSMAGGSVRVFAAEATGPIRTKMHPKLSTNAKWIWSIYLGLTVACVLSYWAAGVNWFDSVNYAMTTTATGGFSTHNDSASFFVTPAVEYVSALFQFLSGINFTLLYLTLFKFRFRDMLKKLRVQGLSGYRHRCHYMDNVPAHDTCGLWFRTCAPFVTVPGNLVHDNNRYVQRQRSSMASHHMGHHWPADVPGSICRFNKWWIQVCQRSHGIRSHAQ